jgi:hypothetical protein|tara:strand:- start:1264 stop:1437 length:174 start_codon:yes stop_codon:yes gene_type:complete
MTLEEIKRELLERIKNAKYNGQDEIVLSLSQAAMILEGLITQRWDDITVPITDDDRK